MCLCISFTKFLDCEPCILAEFHVWNFFAIYDKFRYFEEIDRSIPLTILVKMCLLK